MTVILEPTVPTTGSTTDPTVAEVLERAADLLEEYDWCQGEFAKDSDGCAVVWESDKAQSFCALGVAYRAWSDLGQPHFPLVTSMQGYLDVRDVTAWNDEPGRTKAEVIAKLREAATLARRREEAS